MITHELTNIKHGQWTTIRAAVAKIRLNQIQIVKKFDRASTLRMDDDFFYKLDRKRMGTAIIVNNLNKEQTPTRNDVERMSNVLKVIGKF